MKEHLIECSFLIPVVRDSNRAPHPRSAWRALGKALMAAFPEGHTGPEVAYRDVRPVKGEYADFVTGRIVRDLSRRYTVAVPIVKLHALRRMLSRTATTFDQKAIYLSVAGRVEFVFPDRKGGLT